MKLPRRALFAAPFLAIPAGCSKEDKKEEKKVSATQPIDRQPFGAAGSGQPVELFTLKNSAGLTASITNYGGIVTSLLVPGRQGKLSDVVLGFDSLDGYLQVHPYFGAIVGRYGNRIAQGRFTLNGVEYKLAQNNGPNSLHGGIRGFDKKVWEPTVDGGKLLLASVSPDGDEGYPGAMKTTVTYRVTDANELRIDYEITTDKDTVHNVTNHTYFNLAGEGSATVLDHEVQIEAEAITPVDATLIPTGKLMSVAGTPFDFRTPHTIGERIEAMDDEQIRFGGGYDHNFVLKGMAGTLRRAATVKHAGTGRVMEVETTEPGLQFYTGNFLDGKLIGKSGAAYVKRSGFCMETQHFPDSPNQPAFPSTVLKAGATYRSTTIYRFSTAS